MCRTLSIGLGSHGLPAHLPPSWARFIPCDGASPRSPGRVSGRCKASLSRGPIVEQGLAASLLGAGQRHPSGLSSRRRTPCTNPQPGSELPGLCLIWVFSPRPPPNQMALCGLKRQAWGAGGAQRRAVATAGSRAPAAVPLPLARPTHPSGCGENQAPRPRPARVAALHRGGGRVEHSPPCPSQAASLPLVFI